VLPKPGINATVLLISTLLLRKLRQMNANEFRRWLRRQGCTFHMHKGSSGHVTVRLGNRTTQLPMHGGSKELGQKLVAKTK